jgi:hypothetical protein
MDNFFFWLVDNPPGGVKTGPWEDYLSTMAVYAILFIALVGAAVVLLYVISANRRKIHRPDDCFAPYTPMRWLWLELLVFAGVATLAYFNYEDLKSSEAQINISMELAGYTFLLGLILTYFVILIPGITPLKFRYRPLWFLYAGKGVKSVRG